MSSCCGHSKEPKAIAKPAQTTSSCCPSTTKKRIDWLLVICSSITIVLYGLHLAHIEIFDWLSTASHSIYSLINTMWWSVLLAIVFVGLLSKVPQTFVMATLGNGGSWSGLFRATGAGVLLDLCSHGILMVGMKLYQKGASLGQVMAFLIASPWNSFSLTLIMFALIGIKWTLAFIGLSMLLAITTGWLFDKLVAKGALPANPNAFQLDDDFNFKQQAKTQWQQAKFDRQWYTSVLTHGFSASTIVLRWLLFGVVLISLIRAFVNPDDFQTWFGPSLVGLSLTLLAATVIEVCSEGSAPIAADLINRAGAPGNSFAFLMAGVATDYTEVMVIKQTMKSWKIALFLPLLTLPQVVVIAWLLNTT